MTPEHMLPSPRRQSDAAAIRTSSTRTAAEAADEWWCVDLHMKPRAVQSNYVNTSHQKLGMSLAARIFQQVKIST